MITSFFLWVCSPTRATPSSCLRFLDHTQRRTTFGRTPLDEWSARRRDLYLTTHNTHNRQTSTPPVGFEPTISAGERTQTYALDRAATGTGHCKDYKTRFLKRKRGILLSIVTSKRARRPRNPDWFPVDVWDCIGRHVQTASGTHTSFYSMGTPAF